MIEVSYSGHTFQFLYHPPASCLSHFGVIERRSFDGKLIAGLDYSDENHRRSLLATRGRFVNFVCRTACQILKGIICPRDVVSQAGIIMDLDVGQSPRKSGTGFDGSGPKKSGLRHATI
jgi:hypothetical protein